MWRWRRQGEGGTTGTVPLIVQVTHLDPNKFILQSTILKTKITSNLFLSQSCRDRVGWNKSASRPLVGFGVLNNN
jgi:hypothetical protein